MKKPTMRVHLTAHDDGRLTAILLRRRSRWDDPPPPSAYGRTEEEVLLDLEVRLAEIVARGEDVGRYLWTEQLHARRVTIEVHPLAMAGPLPVVGGRSVPLAMTFVWCELRERAFYVMFPQHDWWALFEDLESVPSILRTLVSAALAGRDPTWLVDFRGRGEERVRTWEPGLLPRVTRQPLDATTDPPELARVAEEWVERAARRKLPPVVGPDAGARELADLLLEQLKPILLVGEPGVGKTATVRRAARLLARARKERPVPRLYATSAERILSGMVYLGMWQERCLKLIAELGERGDVLYVERLAPLVRPIGGGGSLADAFAPAVIGREIGFLSECTEAELSRARRVAPSLLDACRILRIDETPAAEVPDLMQAYQSRRRSQVVLHPSALLRAARHLDAFERHTLFPGKAFRFLDWLERQSVTPPEAELRFTTKSVTPPEAELRFTTKPLLGADDVTRAYARYTGLPVDLLSDDRRPTASRIETELSARVIGQGAACRVAAGVVARLAAGMNDPERPIGSLLFVGPTGVGKTELAKQLAGYVFGDERRMIRLDMAEHSVPGSAARLLAVGGGGPPSLAARLREQPLAVVLLDEIEKAHPEVHDLLIALLGEGRLTDAEGRLADARMALFVMTSNLGATDAPAAGFGERPAPDYARAVRHFFRPELVGRLDHVVVFHHLAAAEVDRIVDLELAKINTRAGLVRRGLRILLSPSTRARVVELGYRPEWGARPLKRVLEEEAVAPAAVRMAADPSLRDKDILV